MIIICTSVSSPIMRPFHPSQAPFLLSLTIHSISAQLDLGTQLAYPTEFDLTPVLAFTDGLIPKEDYASNTDNKECHSANSQRRMRARAYNNDDPSPVLCPYEPGAAVRPQYNFKQPPEAGQQQLDGTKETPNNPDPDPHPGNEKQKWWERLLTPIQDLVRPGREDRTDNSKAPPMSDALCPEPNRQVAVCSAAIPNLSGPGELVIEYCRFPIDHTQWGPIVAPFISDCVNGEKAWCCKDVFITDIKPTEDGNDELTSKRAAYKLTGEYCLLLIN